MFPIKDHNPSHKFPIVTYTIIFICSVLWLYEFSLGDWIEAFFEIWALQPKEIVAGTALFTLFSSMFLHGWWMHIIWNMLFLYIFWDNLEARMWHIKFIIFYLVSWLVASALQIFSDPTSMIPNIGASGAIAWVMGGYLFLYPKARVDTVVFLWVYIRKITLPAFLMLGYWFATQVLSGTASIGQANVWWVAYWAHIGWFVAGLIFVIPYKFFGKKIPKKRYYKKYKNKYRKT